LAKKKKKAKIGILSAAGYLFGFLFLLNGVFSTISGVTSFDMLKLFYGIIVLLTGVLAFPPAFKYFSDKFNVELSVGLRLVLILVLFFLSGSLIKSSPDYYEKQTESYTTNRATTLRNRAQFSVISSIDKVCYGSHKCIAGEFQNIGTSTSSGPVWVKITFRDCSNNVIGFNDYVAPCKNILPGGRCAFDYTVSEDSETFCSYSIVIEDS